MAKTTPADFTIFCDAVRAWQEKLGLTEWDIRPIHENIAEALADTRTNNDARIVTMRLNKNWSSYEPVTPDQLRRVALHEVLHVLLSDIVWIGGCRYTSDSELGPAEHSVVRRLERVLGVTDA